MKTKKININEFKDLIKNLIKEEYQKEDKLKGGLADDLTKKDIADKFNIKVSDINKELSLGVKIEKEHTADEKIAKEIALDHLAEIPDYYSRLKKMEKEAKQYWKENK